MNAESLEKGYDPSGIEKKWYEHWESNGFFDAMETSGQPAYSIVIPPPNVTGVLHMGHALNVTIQDILCRYRRLCGDNVLWMPGTDHAGIATQNVVERNLAQQGITRDMLGREKFIEAVWEWREKSGGAIINQLKRIGASCDWKRERFTMDQGLSEAVRKVFVRLYKEGLIYQGQYIINWCTRCKTALADLEVEHEDHDSFLYYIKYPFPSGKGGLTVATTRPETMFGDTAVAINPKDDRYSDLTETHVILPLAGKKIPIIRDEYVAMDFGTGALKVTPSHDPNDFSLGAKHGLDSVKVIDDDGNMMEGAGRFKGLDRFKCRTQALEALTAEGFLLKKEPLKNSVGHCYRCKTIVEPSLSWQWFVKAGPLAKVAADAVREGRTTIIPANWSKTYFEWLDNIRDWCISRQIWWGHRIPVWKCSACGAVIVEEVDPDVCPSCGSASLAQETDVLDTWFSSALWPFSTMGWPEKTELLKTFYPTQVLVTGFDILFFWVARMMMMGTHFMGDVPFRDVYIHALVRDEHGKKMSKSKGNVIDPLKVIDSYGADAFRFTLSAFAAQGRDVKMSEERVEGYRNFVNKLWNASRFALMHLDKDSGSRPVPAESWSPADAWIMSRMSATAQAVGEGIETYKFNEAASAAYQFVWHEFCDWYLEAAKPALYEKFGTQSRDASRYVLNVVLKNILIILHPFMPFVTEEIWHLLPTVEGSVSRAEFPRDTQDSKLFRDFGIERNMEFVFGVISGIRNIRSEMNIKPSITLAALVHTLDSDEKSVVDANRSMIENLARLDSLVITENSVENPSAAIVVVRQTTIKIPLEGVIDFDKEEQRLEKEVEKLTKELFSISKRLTNESFLDKAPIDVVDKVRLQKTELEEKTDKLKHSLERIKQMKH
ncbi:MAG: valine--tRNA ligase [Pseudomonadota bacterium]